MMLEQKIVHPDYTESFWGFSQYSKTHTIGTYNFKHNIKDIFVSITYNMWTKHNHIITLHYQMA